MKLLLLFILLSFIAPSVTQEWGIRGSWTPSCNPTIKLYEGMPKVWFESRDIAVHYVEQSGDIGSSYLLLYREMEGKTEWLRARIEILYRKNNETQLSIRGLPEYFYSADHFTFPRV